MGGKVFHVRNDTHAKVKVYCDARKIKIRDWIGDLVDKAISGEPIVIQPIETEPVERKTLQPHQPSGNDDSPYSRPPFWANEE